MQEASEKGENSVISYASKGLSDVERRYSQTEKEALGIVWVCERFHVYLYGVDFERWTDHKPPAVTALLIFCEVFTRTHEYCGCVVTPYQD